MATMVFAFDDLSILVDKYIEKSRMYILKISLKIVFVYFKQTIK